MFVSPDTPVNCIANKRKLRSNMCNILARKATNITRISERARASINMQPFLVKRKHKRLKCTYYPYTHDSLNIPAIKNRMKLLKPTTLMLVLLLMVSHFVEPTIAKKSKKEKHNSSSTSSTSSSTSAVNKHHNNKDKDNKEGQRFAMEPQDQTAVVGSRVTLPCRVIDKIGALQWTKDDFGLGQHRNLSGFERYSMVGSDEEGDFSLDIYPVMLDDDARYQCQVGPGPLGEPGIRSTFATLTVLVPPEAPKITQGDYLVTTEDREIELECVSVGGKPAAEITWIDGLGNVLTKGIEYVKVPLADERRSTAKSILKLVPKKEHHNTTFTCQAQNTADRTYRSAKLLLEVKYAPKVAVSVVGGALAGGRIPEGAEVILSCQGDANPQDLSYRWFINDEPVLGDYTTKMIIHNVTRQYHDAVVKCEVANAVGKSEESETLDISYGPVFRHRPVSVEADLESTVNMRCDVDGNPTPEIEWINENSDKVVGTTPNLTLKVTSETAGRYFCKAVVSGFPEIGAEATIYVKRAPMITSPKVQFGAVGQRIKIDCLAFSIPRAENILWSFNGKIINISTADPDVYIFEENHLPEGVRAALIVKESRSNSFGKYNCTVINSYGSDSLVISVIAEPAGSIPVLLVAMGSMSTVAILMVVMLAIIQMKRSKKKPMPADVIPEASRGVDKLTDIKNEIRAKAYDANYSETNSDGLSINLTHTPMPDVQKGATLGVPLAGPVKLDDRFSNEFGDRFKRQCHLKNIKNQDYRDPTSNTTTSTSTTSGGGGNGGNGYAPYFEYALDYSPPVEGKHGRTQSSINSSTLPHYTNTVNSNTSPSGGSSGNMSLPRNRADMQQQQQQQQHQQKHHQQPQQQQQTPNHSTSHNQMGNGYMGHQPSGLLQNGIDSRFSAIYGNPYLRTNSSILPPLPPPSTANPAATPAPPPYHAARQHHNAHHHHVNGGIKNFGNNAIIALTGTAGVNMGSGSNSSCNLTASSNTLAAMTPLAQAPQLNSGTPLSVAPSPSGQFILPSNGNSKKGALATHV